MNNSIRSKLLEIMSIVFNDNINNLNENISMNNYKKWDSLAHLNLIFALEEEFEIKLDDFQTINMNDFKSIFQNIKKNLTK